MNFYNVTIAYVKGSAYRIHFWYMIKDDPINIINGSNLIDKSGDLSNFFVITFFGIYIYIYNIYTI